MNSSPATPQPRALRSSASRGFYGPYFGITEDKKYYAYAEPADGPIVQRFAALAQELSLVMVLPIYEEAMTGVYYNTAVVVDSDGTILGKYRKHHLPHLDRFWEKFYFRPGNLGYPVFQTAVGPIGVYICYDRHFPEGWRDLGLAGAHLVFNPNATKPGLSNRLWEVEGPCAAVANGYFVLQPNRVGREDNEYGGWPSTSTAPARSSTRAATSLESADPTRPRRS
ncbi:nitrilase-related carbon-nitrogen hydrolase [Aeromicrobium sp. UC242_57]|uniref:nitrilase-related carbon-nitrogen hydrolase n=1 Tax=Aeromicrobium sp. UC242_57 TaxID=3374624 RepID=UPI0037AA3185